jgi:hypothetical protein
MFPGAWNEEVYLTRAFPCGTIALALSLIAAPSLAQRQPVVLPPDDTSRVITLRLTDGSELTGRVVARDDTSLTLVTIAGLRVNAPRRTIAGWRVERGRVSGGRLVRNDPNVSRLFFAPTGRTLARGSGYFADYYLFFPFVAAGLTDFVTVAAGASILPGISLKDQLVYVAPKIGLIQRENVALAVGALYVSVPGEGGDYAGGGYAVATFGDEDQALTVLGGYPVANGQSTREPTFMLGAEQRVSSRAKLLMEIWKLSEVEQVVPSIFGIRFFGSRLSVDFGLLYLIGAETEGFPFFPWVDFVVSW